MAAPTLKSATATAIAIIGAGPAGLTLAHLLHTSQKSTSSKISVTVFEKDASATARLQVGGTLDLHDDTGLAALRAAGLMAEFEKWARYDGEALVIADKNATGVVRMGGSTKEAQGAWSRPEIDRERLKELLLASVEGQVKWGWKLKAVSTEDGMLEFEGREGREGPFDLVVGADGAWSRVRGVLTDVRPSYSGISGFELKLSRPNDDFPAVSALVGRGSYFANSDRKGISAQRMGNESIKVGCWLAEDEGYAQDVLAQRGVEGTRAEILRRFADWAPELRDVVKCSDEDYIVPWTLYELPVGHTWTHKKGFTLIGDAAALMTPFAGEGVNKAMMDALELSAAICRSRQAGGDGADDGSDLDMEVAKYERAMFPRAAKVQAETFRNKTTMFQDDAPLGFLMAMMASVTEEVKPALLGSILRVALWPMVFSYLWLRITIGRLVRQFWTRT